MTSVQELEDKIQRTLHRAAEEVAKRPLDPASYKVYLEKPRNESFGDLAASFVLRLAKEEKKAPHDLARTVAEKFTALAKSASLEQWISAVRVEGPGYINIEFSHHALAEVFHEIHLTGARFGQSKTGQDRRILLEFVSANPTGPLTVAHGRQAALGDSLSRILQFIGCKVSTEYYNNDEGVQIETLGQSAQLWLRKLLFKDKEVVFPEHFYRGAYLEFTVQNLIRSRGKDLEKMNQEEQIKVCAAFAKSDILKGIERDLADFDVRFDSFYSQERLSRSGKVEAALDELKRKKVVYDQDGALWFRSTDFGDDKDRVLVKQDKSYTYLTPDLSYHHEKFGRGYNELINIWGPDHHGYVSRLKASQVALGHDVARLKILIAQLVKLYKGKEQVRMSTRAGEFVTLRQILDEVGKDAARFFFCMRKFESHLDFDLELAKKQTPDNPVFYIQYAHARISSIRKLQEEQEIQWDWKNADLGCLREPQEIRVMKVLRQFPGAVRASASQLEPCILVEYMGNLATSFHQFYTECRVIGDDSRRTQARLTLVYAVQRVIGTGLNLLGVSAPDSM